MKYAINVYMDSSMVESGRISLQTIADRATDQMYKKITEQLRNSIEKSVKEQLNNRSSDELLIIYDLESFNRERQKELNDSARHV